MGRVVEQDDRLGGLGLGGEPVRVEGQLAPDPLAQVLLRFGLVPRGREVPDEVGLVGGPGGRVRDLVQEEGHVGAVVLQALAVDQLLHHPGEEIGVAVAGPLAGGARLGGQARRVREAAGERGFRRGPQRRVPLKGRQAQLVRQAGVARDLLAAGGHVAELEEVQHAPVAGLQLEVWLAGGARRVDHRGRGPQALLDAVRAPQRHVAGVERRGQRARVAGAPRWRRRRR